MFTLSISEIWKTSTSTYYQASLPLGKAANCSVSVCVCVCEREAERHREKRRDDSLETIYCPFSTFYSTSTVSFNLNVTIPLIGCASKEIKYVNLLQKQADYIPLQVETNYIFIIF